MKIKKKKRLNKLIRIRNQIKMNKILHKNHKNHKKVKMILNQSMKLIILQDPLQLKIKEMYNLW
jgi:hypothetical protein